jgi:hypothetical protein
MVLPPVNHKIWGDIVTGKANFEFECLAVKILLGRLRAQVTNDPMSVQSSATELYNFFEKNQKLPSAQRDLEKIGG